MASRFFPNAILASRFVTLCSCLQTWRPTSRLLEQPLTPPRLILASRSPQRRAILDQLGILLEVRVAEVEELESGPPHEVALENARRKASAVASTGDPDALVLGVDTVVALGDRLYGKPTDAADAQQTLQALSGRAHAVIGGLCLIDQTGTRTAVSTTEVEFRLLEGDLLDWYLSTGEWRERAGAYAIQAKGAALVKRIDGDYLNVVGLPVGALLELEPGLLTLYRRGKCPPDTTRVALDRRGAR